MGVGKVEKIELADVGKVLVSVSLPDKIKPRMDASATVVSVGFVGDCAVEFDPGKGPSRSRGAASSSAPRRRASPTGRRS